MWAALFPRAVYTLSGHGGIQTRSDDPDRPLCSMALNGDRLADDPHL
jgi:hypothetical protein